jgi:hypothetical protein
MKRRIGSFEHSGFHKNFARVVTALRFTPGCIPIAGKTGLCLKRVSSDRVLL